jgi:tetratricopeptide (TPR) repeat protein
MKQSRVCQGAAVDLFREIGDWVLGFVEWFSNWKADPETRTKLQYIAAIFGIVAASCTIAAAFYKFMKWLRRRTPEEESDEARALAEQLAKQARERGMLEGMREASLALSQKDDQIKGLTRTIEELCQGAVRGTLGMDEALAMLREGKFEAAEAVFAEIAEAKAAEGAAANKEAAHALRNLGNIAFLHDTEKALDAYVKATQLDPDNPEGWNQLGLSQWRIGEWDAAIDSFERVITVGGQLASHEWISIATSNMGNVYSARGDLGQAETMYLKALTFDETLNRPQGLATNYSNLGNIYSMRGKLDQAEKMFLKSLPIEEALGRMEGAAADYDSLGTIYRERGDLGDRRERQIHPGALRPGVEIERPSLLDQRHVQRALDMHAGGDGEAGDQRVFRSAVDAAMRFRLGERHRLDRRAGGEDERHGNLSVEGRTH